MIFKSSAFKKAFCTIAQPLQVTLNHLTGAQTGIALVEIDNPTSRNALSRKFISDLKKVIETLHTNKDVRVAILRSKTPGMFCAGADLKERSKMTDDESEQFVVTLRDTFDDFYNIPVPTIACIDGPALGGGLELALSCDMRIASKTSLIGLTETGLAIIPGAGGTQKLSRVIGLAKAKELIFTARRLTAPEALQFGILNYVEESYEKAFEKSTDLASQILKCGPIAIKLAKQALNAGYEVDLKRGLEIEKLCYSKIVGTEDRIEGLKAFVEKRKPVYKGK